MIWGSVQRPQVERTYLVLARIFIYPPSLPHLSPFHSLHQPWDFMHAPPSIIVIFMLSLPRCGTTLTKRETFLTDVPRIICVRHHSYNMYHAQIACDISHLCTTQLLRATLFHQWRAGASQNVPRSTCERHLSLYHAVIVCDKVSVISK